MIIAHNMLSNFTNRQLGITNKDIARRSERLSSGYRINRAADDAAGLSISEKMRGQIRGLDRAGTNCSDGISLINTADGGMADCDAILHRIRELCVQAANDTYTSEDREDIRFEIERLEQEIDRVGKQTEFNTIKVLQGGRDVEVDTGQRVTKVTYAKTPLSGIKNASGQIIDTAKYYYLGDLGDANSGVTINSFDRSGNAQSRTISTYAGKSTDYNSNVVQDVYYGYTLDFSSIDGSTHTMQELDKAGFTFNCSLGCDQEFSFIFDSSINDIKDETPSASTFGGGTLNNKVFRIGTGSFKTGADLVEGLTKFIATHINQQSSFENPFGDVHVGHDNAVGYDGSKLIVFGSMRGRPGDPGDGFFIVGLPHVEEIPVYDVLEGDGPLYIQAGANAKQMIDIRLPKIDAETLEMERIDVSDAINATSSLEYIGEMLDYVNGERARMGAYANRLESAFRNDRNTEENLQSAESRIRDADMADEIVTFSKSSILQQAGQSMLAQANSATEGVLSLLQ